MDTRKWIVAGSVTGLAALILFVALATIAFFTPHPLSPKLLVLGIADVTLAMTSVKLLGDAATMTKIERCTSRYVEGVGDTVDRLASVLPQKDNVRRIG